MESRTRDVANFFHSIPPANSNSANVTLDTLLNLPSLSDLRSSLSEDILARLTCGYDEQAKHLIAVAELYRRIASDVKTIDPGTAFPSGWENNINILLGFGNTEKPTHVYTGAFNKIKHRFMVTENLPAYGNPQLETALEYAVLKSDPGFVDKMIQATTGAAASIAELGAIVIALGDAGVAI